LFRIVSLSLFPLLENTRKILPSPPPRGFFQPKRQTLEEASHFSSLPVSYELPPQITFPPNGRQTLAFPCKSLVPSERNRRAPPPGTGPPFSKIRALPLPTRVAYFPPLSSFLSCKNMGPFFLPCPQILSAETVGFSLRLEYRPPVLVPSRIPLLRIRCPPQFFSLLRSD